MVKIGMVHRVANLQARIVELQAGCPYPLRLVLIMDGGDRRNEARLHSAFDQYRFRGEWFRIEGEIASLLAKSKADPTQALATLARLAKPLTISTG